MLSAFLRGTLLKFTASILRGLLSIVCCINRNIHKPFTCSSVLYYHQTECQHGKQNGPVHHDHRAFLNSANALAANKQRTHCVSNAQRSRTSSFHYKQWKAQCLTLVYAISLHVMPLNEAISFSSSFQNLPSALPCCTKSLSFRRGLLKILMIL